VEHGIWRESNYGKRKIRTFPISSRS
jgi:hypothetical protein